MAYPTITLDDIISAAFLRLDSEDSRDELVFQDWAWDALREIGPSKVDTDTKCVEVNDFCIEKPSGFLYMLNMNLLDASGNVLYYQMQSNKPLKSENRRGVDTLTFSTNGNLTPIRCSEGKDYFELSTNATSVSSAELSFYCFPMDDDGQPLFEEKMKEAILAFIEHMYVKRQRHRERANIPLSEVQYLEDVWRRKRQEVRGDIKMPDPNEFNNIARKWVTAIPNFKDRVRNSRGGYNRGRY